jgi:hypothetical protein
VVPALELLPVELLELLLVCDAVLPVELLDEAESPPPPHAVNERSPSRAIGASQREDRIMRWS